MKTKITLIILLFLFSLRTIAQSNLIGCYPLDNNSNDNSGNNHHGTGYNLTPASDRFSNPNHAYHFSGVNSGVIINDSAFHLNSYTYSIWCNLASLPSVGFYYCVMSIGGGAADQVLLVGNNSTFGHIGFGFGSWDSTGGNAYYYMGTLPNINQWYHVVITRDNDTMKLYVNNILIGFDTTGVNAGYMGNPHTFSIGTRIDTLSQNFVGDIDDVKVIDHVLTIAEIALLDSTCNLFTNVNSHESRENFISVFPNPFTTDLVLGGTTSRGEMILFDVHGKEIARQKTLASQTIFNSSEITAGFYILNYTDDNKIINIKLLKF